MGKTTKQRNYDTYISPGKRYLYRKRRILFVFSVMTFIFNMSLIAVFDDSMRKVALVSIFLSLFFAIVQLVDDRKVLWEWCYIIDLSVMCLIFSALGAFFTDFVVMRYIWVGELVFFCGFILLFFRKKNKK